MPHVAWSSDGTLRVELDEHVGPRARRRVQRALNALRDATIPGLIEACPAFTTVQLAFDAAALAEPDPLAPQTRRADSLVALVQRCVDRACDDLDSGIAPAGRIITIPVCYDAALAPDLHPVADHTGLAPDEVALVHAGLEYSAEFVGFMPGFAYLSGLDPRLATPRLDSPRARVAPGSVAIAGLQSGVYPLATPGGWRIIGRTPLVMFDPSRDPPSLLESGDRVRFTPISRDAFDDLAGSTR